jgi:PAS domain S-box-containing protein
MQTLPNSWYRRLNYVLGVGQLLMLGSYGWLRYNEATLATDFGFNPVTIALICFGVITSLAVAPFVAKKSAMSSALISYFVAITGIGSLIVYSGTLGSIFYPLTILLGFVSGMFGLVVAILFAFGANASIALELLGIAETSASTSRGLVLIAANLAAIIAGYILWRGHFEGDEDKRVSSLATKLQTEQLRSEILFNAIGEGVIATDVYGKIQLINPAASKITSWEQEDSLNVDITSVLRLIKTDEEEERELESDEHPFVKAISDQQNIILEDAMLSTQTNKRVELTITVSPIVIKEEVQGAVAVFRDVTDQRKQERQRAEFISTASHEMRTPVAAIEGYLALALNTNVSTIDSKARSYLEKAHESTQHLGQLFKDLLTAAKSEDGRLTNNPEVVELNDLLKKATDDLRFSAEEKGLKMVYTTAPDDQTKIRVQNIAPLYYVHIDPERMREVITNLITNAIKFTEEGQITIGLRANQESVQITVADTGYGIPEDDIDHLFQKFYRVDNTATRTIGGTGLGLFISRNIVEMYKGRIWVESEVGKGSTFYINLPRLSKEQAEELRKDEAVTAAPLQVEQTL